VVVAVADVLGAETTRARRAKPGDVAGEVRAMVGGTQVPPRTGAPSRLFTRQWDKGLVRLNALRTSLGLDPVDHFFDQLRGARRHVVLTSADFDFPAAVRSVLGDTTFRQGAARLGAAIRRDAASGALVAELEDLAPADPHGVADGCHATSAS
jgi:hypothetical protein